MSSIVDLSGLMCVKHITDGKIQAERPECGLHSNPETSQSVGDRVCVSTHLCSRIENRLRLSQSSDWCRNARLHCRSKTRIQNDVFIVRDDVKLNVHQSIARLPARRMWNYMVDWFVAFSGHSDGISAFFNFVLNQTLYRRRFTIAGN